MSWNVQEYNRGYEAFLGGAAFLSWESAQWRHGWLDASAHSKAKTAIAKARGEK